MIITPKLQHLRRNDGYLNLLGMWRAFRTPKTLAKFAGRAGPCISKKWAYPSLLGIGP